MGKLPVILLVGAILIGSPWGLAQEDDREKSEAELRDTTKVQEDDWEKSEAEFQEFLKGLKVAGSHLWVIILGGAKGCLLWGFPALFICWLLYILVKRLGWLTYKGKDKRLMRVFYAVILFVLVAPLIGLAGTAVEVGKATVHVVSLEVHKHQLLRPVGSVLATPLVLAHITAEGEEAPGDLKVLIQKVFDQQDVSFLLQEQAVGHAVARLHEKFIREALEQSNLDAKLLENEYGKKILASEATKWLYDYGKSKAIKIIDSKLDIYTDLFKGLKADGNGRLSFWQASDQVGDIFFERHVLIPIQASFNRIALILVLAAALLAAITIGILQLLVRYSPGFEADTGTPAENVEKNGESPN